jgi:putative photosynthetic complex assembly protein
MQAAQPAREVIPRRALLAGGAALALIFGGVAAARLSGFDTREPDARTVARRALRFIDRTDGAVAVIDAASGATLDVMHGEQGFLRGTLRGLARERKRRGLDGSEPLQLIGRADGRLTLADPSTGERIDLESFGPANAAVFARWLEPQPAVKVTP